MRTNTIKFKWVAKAQGEDTLDLDDFYITLEEWNEMSEDERLDALQGCMDENYDAIAYGVVTSYELI